MSRELHSLPVLALRETVLFPGVTVPLGVGRKQSVAAVEAAIEADTPRLFAVTQREDGETIQPSNLYTTGVIVRIAQVNRSAESIQLVVQVEGRAHAVRFTEGETHLTALVGDMTDILPPAPGDKLLQALEKELRERGLLLATKTGMPEPMVRQALGSIDGLGPLSDLVASYLELDAADKQSLLETLSVEERARRVLVHIERWIEIRDAQAAIHERVQQEIGDRQKEIVLREQLKAIQAELGESEVRDELAELGERLLALDLPEEVAKEIHRELHRLDSMSPESMEGQVLRTYLETVAELPWNERTDERLDIVAAASILDEDHYGLPDVKDRVLEHLSVLKLQRDRNEAAEAAEAEAKQAAVDAGDHVATETAEEAEPTLDAEPDAAPRRKRRQSPILLFVGPPGVGKTSIARSIARATGREYVRVSLGGARDEADIRGHRRTYVGAMPGRIIEGLRQAGTQNPVFLLDEIDKLGVSYQGDPASALLEVLDPAQNDSFVDHYLGVPFDLSEVLFIATANTLQSIPGPLLDRLEVVEFEGYTEAEKLEIAERYLLPRQIEYAGLRPEEVSVSSETIAHVISRYTREAGVRQLEKQLGGLARKSARKIAEVGDGVVEITPEDVRDFLGKPRARPERAFQEDRVGVSTGMFYTPVGGDILFVEATTMPGNGKLQLTGQLGDVMQESAKAAWSYARSRAPEFLIETHAFDQRDVHLHVPAGAIPKDGPSAGVTLATALVSSLSGVPARHDVAMTGEITLTGQVLPIGGVKEKILGAVRAGIREIIIPRENADDLDDLPESIREIIVVHLVDQLDEVLELALRGGVFRSPVFSD